MASISIPEDVKDRLDQLAATYEQPVAVLVAHAMNEFLEREDVSDDAALQALREEGRESWPRSSATGST